MLFPKAFLLFVTLSSIPFCKADYYVCSSLEQNTDYKGADLGTSKTATVQACADLCATMQKNGCNAFTFWDYTTDRVCFLKKLIASPLRIPSQGRKNFFFKL